MGKLQLKAPRPLAPASGNHSWHDIKIHQIIAEGHQNCPYTYGKVAGQSTMHYRTPAMTSESAVNISETSVEEVNGPCNGEHKLKNKKYIKMSGRN